MSQILALDAAGSPARWLRPKDAALYYVKDLVAWSLGDTGIVLRGGTCAKTGEQSKIVVDSIISVKGDDFMVRHYDRVPTLTQDKLAQRDKNMCAYCGGVFKTHQLEMEHVYPKSRGGPLTWMNLVSACRHCNSRKRDRTPEEAGMLLLYTPYVPSIHEDFLMSNRNILADQMEFLRLSLPRHSRLL